MLRYGGGRRKARRTCKTQEARLKAKRDKESERAEWERQYHSEERCEWTTRQPSVLSGKGPCVNAHVSPRRGLPSGTSRKADYRWIVPVTQEEHQLMHDKGEGTVGAKFGVYLPGKAAGHQAAWLRYRARVSAGG